MYFLIFCNFPENKLLLISQLPLKPAIPNSLSNKMLGIPMFSRQVGGISKRTRPEPLVGLDVRKLGVLTWLTLTGSSSFPMFWMAATSLFFGSGDLDISQVASRIFGGQWFFFRCVEASTSFFEWEKNMSKNPHLLPMSLA